MRIFNKDGFVWFIGVVEDRDDPERLGRCKVRIYGYHSESKVEQPTEDLPFAVPIQPINSAAMNGVGTSPVGPLPGTWVVGFFLDGNDMQQPAFFGTIGTKSAPKTFSSTSAKRNPGYVITETANKNTGQVKDQSGNPIKDSESNDVKIGTPPIQNFDIKNVAVTSSVSLQTGVGTGNKDIGFINDYQTSEDKNGARYGKFELSSFLPEKTPGGAARPSSKGSPLSSYLKVSIFSKQFEGLKPGTNEFDLKWSEVSSANNFNFGEDQDNFIKKNYYDSMVSNLQRKGIDLKKFGPSVQSLAYTTSLQSGPAGGAAIFKKALDGKNNINDNDILESVGEFKNSNADAIFGKLDQTKLNSVKSDLFAQKTSLNDLLPKVPSFGDFPDFQSLAGSISLPNLPSLSGFSAFKGTKDDDLHYFGKDPIIYDRINEERIKRGLPPLANQRPT